MTAGGTAVPVVCATAVRPHLRRMRAACGVVLGALPAVGVLVFFLPRRMSSVLDPGPVTLVCAAAAVWIGFSANRDARVRLDRIKRAFAVHGEVERLLRSHLWVYLAVLLRLGVVALCGVLVSVWGIGPKIGIFLILLAGLLILMTWPTERKTLLLVRRAAALREP